MLLYFSCIYQYTSSYVVISARIECFVETPIAVTYFPYCVGLQVQILNGKMIRIQL